MQAASSTVQPYTEWLQLTAGFDLEIKSTGYANLPTLTNAAPDVEYTLRVRYYVTESKWGEESYLYDAFTLRLRSDTTCADFDWSLTGSSAPTGYTYSIYPTTKTTASGTYTIALPTVTNDSQGTATTCDDNPTVTWWYKPVGGDTFLSATSSHDQVDSTTDTTLVFDSDVWNWGNVDDGIQFQTFKVKYVAADAPTAILEWEFDVQFQNACWNDAVGSWTTSAADIAYPLKNTYDSADRTTGTST